MYKVLVTARSFAKSNKSPIEILENNGCEVIRISSDDADFKEKLREHLKDSHAIIAGLEKYDNELLDLANNLKVISRYGVGYDNIDLKKAKEKNIAVTITPGANEDSVADMALALMLSAARNISHMDKYIKNGTSSRPVGVEMWEKTLGVIGLGRIGKGVVKRAKGFNMNVICYDVFQDEKFAEEYGVKYCDFETLLKEADFITIHAPLTEKTRNMIGSEQFEIMKDSAVIVNTARGGIINEEELYLALKENKIGAAGLDATVQEPPIGSKLAELENCVLSPHAGAATIDAIHKMSMLSVMNLLDILNGVDNKNIVA